MSTTLKSILTKSLRQKPRVNIVKLSGEPLRISNAKQAAEIDRTTLFKGLLEKAYRGSKASAIKLKCLQCNGYEDAIKRTRECTVYQCALWAVRPYQK